MRQQFSQPASSDRHRGFSKRRRARVLFTRAEASPERTIVAIDVAESAVREAADAGYIGLHGDAGREDVIGRARIDRAKAAIVSTGRDGPRPCRRRDRCRGHPPRRVTTAALHRLLTETGQDGVPLFSLGTGTPSMSVVSTAASAVAANQALNAQAMNIAALKMKNEAAQSIVQMLEQAITPAAGADKAKSVDIKV